MATVAVNNLAITGSTVAFDALLDDVAGVDGSTAAFAFNGATVDGSNVDPSCASGTASTFAVTLDWGFVVANFDVTTVANVAGQFPAPITAFDQYTSVMVASWTETFVETLSGQTMTRSMEQVRAWFLFVIVCLCCVLCCVVLCCVVLCCVVLCCVCLLNQAEQTFSPTATAKPNTLSGLRGGRQRPDRLCGGRAGRVHL